MICEVLPNDASIVCFNSGSNKLNKHKDYNISNLQNNAKINCGKKEAKTAG